MQGSNFPGTPEWFNLFATRGVIAMVEAGVWVKAQAQSSNVVRRA